MNAFWTHVPDVAFESKFWVDFASKTISGVIGAGFGAWFGARFAFRRERRKSHEDRELAAKAATASLADQHAAAGNLALLFLDLIGKFLADYRNGSLAPARQSPAPWFWLKANDIRESNFQTFDIAGLSFLMNSRDPKILMKLSIEADRYGGLLNAIQTHSTFNQEHLIPKLEQIDRERPAGERSDIELRDAVGGRVYSTLDNFFSYIDALSEQSLKSSRETANELRALLIELLPEKRIIDFEKDHAHG